MWTRAAVFWATSENRYTMPVLAKSTPGTLIITNKPYNTGIGYSNVTLNAGTTVLDKSVEKTASKITGPLFLGRGFADFVQRRRSGGRR